MRSRCVKMRGRAAGAAQRWHLVLLWLLVAVVGRAVGAGNPVNAAAQEGRAHHIDLDSVGAWESLSRCEWAPLCPSLLLVISLAGENEQERLELQVRTPRSTRRAATQRCKCRSPVCVCRRLVRSILPASFTGVRLSACCISLRYEAPPTGCNWWSSCRTISRACGSGLGAGDEAAWTHPLVRPFADERCVSTRDRLIAHGGHPDHQLS